MDISIILGTTADIDEVAQLYDTLNDYLANTVNFPGWKKGIYPTRENAVTGVAEGALYVAKHQGEIVGTIILNHEPEAAYNGADWKIDAPYEDIFVVHTFAIHPNFLKNSIGKKLLEFSLQLGRQQQIKAIRLDVYENNMPAIKLYEKCGFSHSGTVDLGLQEHGLDQFLLYECLL